MDERMTESERATLCRRIDELCAENEQLRQENQSIGMAAYEFGRNSMADENAKLRELVADMWNDMSVCYEQYVRISSSDMRFYGDRMREMGIEVSE